MAFLEMVTAGREIAERHHAGQIDRETALVELAVLFGDTVITDEEIERFLDGYAPALAKRS